MLYEPGDGSGTLGLKDDAEAAVGAIVGLWSGTAEPQLEQKR